MVNLGKSKSYLAAYAIVGAVFLSAVNTAQADVNGINRFKVRNCTPAKVMVCSYDKTDNILAIPYHSSSINPGGTNKYSCGSADRCKVFTGISEKEASKVIVSGVVVGGAMAAGTAGFMVGAGGATLVLWTVAGSAAAAGIGAGGVLVAGAAVGGVMAVAATIDGVDAGKICKSMYRDQKKMIDDIVDDDLRSIARDAMKKKLKGRWPEYKKYSLTNDSGVLALEEGFKC